MASSGAMDKEYANLVAKIRECRECPLHKYRKNAVPGEGPLNAKIMFVGEAPGKQEDEEGRPFVGAAGMLLTKLIEEAGMRREQVYITNIVKCRPPGNRDPTDEEIRSCIPYLWQQVRLIKPRVIVALGRHAARILFEKAGLQWRSMSQQHGKVYNAEIEKIPIKLIATYHPAAALYKPALREVLFEDFRGVIKKVYREVQRAELGGKGRPRSLLDFLSSKPSQAKA